MPDLLYDKTGHVARITLNRPERLNAISFEMLESLAIAAMKRLVRHGLTEEFEAHSHHVLMQLLTLFRSKDFEEAMLAYVERRPPRFTGR
jgi:enoyl-CoA hydratase/carnithine racemase